MQCVANSTVYVGGAVAALQVLRVRARRQRDLPADGGGERAGSEHADVGS